MCNNCGGMGTVIDEADENTRSAIKINGIYYVYKTCSKCEGGKKCQS